MSVPNENGIYPGVPRDEYEKIHRLNWSTLRHMKRSPYHFRMVETDVTQNADSDAKRIGRATHAALLEPDVFRAQWAVWDGGDRRGKAWTEFKDKHAGFEIVKAAEYQQVEAIAHAARSDKDAGPLLQHGEAELAVLWTHALAGPAWDADEWGSHARIACKGRIDRANGVILDLKTCRDASPEGFARAAWNLDYAAQAAFYVDGYAAATGQRLPYVIVAVENTEPHAVQVYTVPEHILEMGRDLYRGLLERVARCRKESRWPSYSDGPMELPLPRWARASNEDEDITGLGLVVNE